MVGMKVIITNGLAWNNVECIVVKEYPRAPDYNTDKYYDLKRLDTGKVSHEFQDYEFTLNSKLHKALR